MLHSWRGRPTADNSVKALFQNVSGTCRRPGLSMGMATAHLSPGHRTQPAHLRVPVSNATHDTRGCLHRVVADVVMFQVLLEPGQKQRAVVLWREKAFHHRLGAGQGGGRQCISPTTKGLP